MAESLDARLKAYRRRINELQERRSMPLDAHELRSIAAEFDLSDEDLAAADDMAYERFQEGEAQLARHQHDAALDAFADAVALRPDWLEYRVALARAYLARFESHGRDHDRYRVIELTQDCLETQPGYRPAVEVVDRLNARLSAAPGPAPSSGPQAATSTPHFEPPPIPPGSVPERKNSPMFGVILFMLLSSNLCCCGLFGLLPSNDYEEDVYEDAYTPAPVVAVPEPEPAPVVAHDGTKGKGVHSIPLEITQRGGDAFGYETVRSQLKVYGVDNAYYEVWFQTRNDEAKREIVELPMVLTLYDIDGKEVARKDSKALTKLLGATMRPGDTNGQRRLIKTHARVARAEIVIGPAKSQPAKLSYPASEPLTVEWASPTTISEQIDFKVRSQVLKVYDGKKNKGYFKVEIEVTNGSSDRIDTLETFVTFEDAAGKELGKEKWYLTGSLNMPIVPGETRIVKRTFSVPRSYSNFEMRIESMKVGD